MSKLSNISLLGIQVLLTATFVLIAFFLNLSLFQIFLSSLGLATIVSIISFYRNKGLSNNMLYGLYHAFYAVIFGKIAQFGTPLLILSLLGTLTINYFWIYRPLLARYITRRIGIFIPTFLLVSFAAFYISQQSPKDPVDAMTSSFDGSSGFQKNSSTLEAKDKLREKFGLNKPGFYISIRTLADSDTLHRVKNRIHQDNLSHLTRKYGNWEAISTYYHAVLSGLKRAQLLDAQAVFEQNSDFNSEQITVDTTRLCLYNRYSARFIDSSYLSQLRPYGDSAWLQFQMDTILSNETLNQKSYDQLVRASSEEKDHLYYDLNGARIEIAAIWFTKDSLTENFTFRPDSGIVGKWPLEDIQSSRNALLNAHNILLSTSYEKSIQSQISLIDSLVNNLNYLSEHQNSSVYIKRTYKHMTSHTSGWKNFIPSISFNGLDNRYHNWLFGTKSWYSSDDDGTPGLLRGDFGLSYEDGKPVRTELWRKFKMSFELVLFSIFIAYLISIPIGVYAAYRRGSWFDKGSAFVLFILYSLPNFFVGLLLINWFANPDNFEWFYASGSRPEGIPDSQYYGEMGYLGRLKVSWPYMVLPIATYTYASFAFISRVMRVGMLETLEQDYIRTARAKGLSERQVILKHAFRNSLIPIITVFASVFPLAVGGSVIIEMIFTYPGMGWTALKAIEYGDYPVIIAIFCMAGFLTMFGYLVSDILYAIVDPRISLVRRK